jgi:hypothetical protein
MLIGGVVVGSVLMEGRWGISRYLIAPPWVHAVLYLGPLIIIALAVGFAAAPRGALAALGAYILGVVLWVTLQLRPGPPGSSDVWGYEQWGSFILTMLPSAIGSAVIGAVGSWIARLRTRHMHGVGSLRAGPPTP